MLAGVLIVIFKGDISALIPLYAFGVFTGFTLSQAGMVVHHCRLREPHWRASAVVNGVGCVATGVVAIVVVVSKFTEGAWIPAVLIPALVVLFRAIGRHYRRVRAAVAVDTDLQGGRGAPTSSSCWSVRCTAASSTPCSTPDRWRPNASSPSRWSPIDDEQEAARSTVGRDTGCRSRCTRSRSPYRELTRPILEYLDELDAENPTTSSRWSSPSS